MKKIKIFSAVLALGLGLTATYAFKAHKTTVVAASLSTIQYETSFGGYYFVPNPINITSVSDPNCGTLGTGYCDVTYDGTASAVTGGINIYSSHVSDFVPGQYSNQPQ